MQLPAKSEIERAAEIAYAAMSPTPQYTWPLLNERMGAEVWLKHENHTAVGTFKIRGALVYLRHLRGHGRPGAGAVTATRGNHGQAVGYAARSEGIAVTVYVPHGNSASKNNSMRALGVRLVEHGHDFEEARQEALRRSRSEGLIYIPSFDPLLVAGAATYSFELLSAVRDIDVVYVPVGLGSGICGMCAAREALGLTTEIVGVVSRQAPAYRDSFLLHAVVERAADTRLADGLACRVPEPDALDILWRHVSRIVSVTDAEIASAMRVLFEDTHNVVEGAGAAGLAAMFNDVDRIRGRRVATVLSGGNVDREVYGSILSRAAC